MINRIIAAMKYSVRIIDITDRITDRRMTVKIGDVDTLEESWWKGMKNIP